MLLFFCFVFVVFSRRRRYSQGKGQNDLEHDTALYFVNVNDNDDIQLWQMNFTTEVFEQKCNFGSQYTEAYRKYQDYENIRTGSGAIDPWYNQYTVFLHNDVNNRQSGDLLKCQLDTNEVTVLGKYPFSCEHVDGSGAVVFTCASTMNKTYENMNTYTIFTDHYSHDSTTPYYSIPGKGNTCFFDEDDQYWCLLYLDGESDTKYFIDLDLGVLPHYTNWTYTIENEEKIYSIDMLDVNSQFAVIECATESSENSNEKAVVELVYDKHFAFSWSKHGAQTTINKVSDISANVIAACYYDHHIFLKVYDDSNTPQLLRMEWKSGDDKIVDTSKIGDLTYMSQMTCL